MIIAQQKKDQNIVEYILYMWQVEDIIRASKLNIDIINEHIVQKYDKPQSVKEKILSWYESHIEMMENEKKKEKGHLIYIENIVNDLNELHIKLIQSEAEKEYKTHYKKALPVISELKAKSGGEQMSELEVALNGVYGFLMLRISGQNITKETSEAVQDISNMLAFLAARYKKIEQGMEEI